MSILNVDKIQPIGGGSTITVDATDIQASTGTITANSYTGVDNTLKVSIGGTEYVRTHSTGQVSIGSTFMWRTDTVAQVYGKSPDLSLSRFNDQFMIAGNETNGAINTGAGIQFFGHDGVSERGMAYIRGLKENGTSGDRASYLAFATRINGGTLEERLRITSAGLIGIGTVSPSGPIHAHVASGTQRSYLEASASHSFLRLKSGSTSYNSGVEFFSGASNIANVNGLGAGGLQFEVNGSERLRITSVGDISLRSTTQNAHLGLTANSTAINFTLGSTAGASPRMYLYGTGNGQSTAGDIFTASGIGGELHYRSGGLIKFEVNSDNTTAEALRITSGGEVVINNSSPIGGKLEINTGSEVNGSSDHDGQNFAINIRAARGSALNSEGNGICFSQHWYSGSTTIKRTAAIVGIKNNQAGGYGGGLKIKYQPDGSGAMQEALRINSSGRVAIAANVDPASILDIREENDGGQTKIMLYNTDNDNTTTQTAGLFMSPDSRAYAYAGVSVIKEIADMSSNAGRDVSLVLNVTENNSQVEALRIKSRGYREIRNYHYGPWAFSNDTWKSTITVSDPGDHKHTTIKFILTIIDGAYRQGFWQGEFVIWSSNAVGGPGVSHIYKKIWDNVGSTNWSGGTVSYQMAGGAFQFKADNGHDDAAGNAYIHVLDVIGDIDGSTVATISA